MLDLGGNPRRTSRTRISGVCARTEVLSAAYSTGFAPIVVVGVPQSIRPSPVSWCKRKNQKSFASFLQKRRTFPHCASRRMKRKRNRNSGKLPTYLWLARRNVTVPGRHSARDVWDERGELRPIPRGLRREGATTPPSYPPAARRSRGRKCMTSFE